MACFPSSSWRLWDLILSPKTLPYNNRQFLVPRTDYLATEYRRSPAHKKHEEPLGGLDLSDKCCAVEVSMRSAILEFSTSLLEPMKVPVMYTRNPVTS